MSKKIISIIVLVSLIFTFNISVFAESISEINKKKQEAENEKSEVSKEKSAIMKEIESLNVSINDNQDKVEELKIELNQLSKDIEQLKVELKETEKKYTAQEELLKKRITAQYEAGETTFLDVVLNSKSFSDFLSNYFLVSEILENDSDLLSSIEEQKIKIEKDKQSLEDKQKDLKTKKAEQEKIQVVLNNQKVQKQNKVSQLSNEEKTLSDKIDEYNEAIKQLEEEARKASQGGSNSEFVGGDMIWPCPGSKRITSYFGNRESPGGVGSTNHKGIDVGASAGTAIVAALDGKVIQSGYNKARGYYVMIDHGGGTITLYQHGLEGSITVSVGQKVSKGQKIMGVGSTGYSTGNHLHFEIWKNGTPVNPLSYVRP